MWPYSWCPFRGHTLLTIRYKVTILSFEKPAVSHLMIFQQSCILDDFYLKSPLSNMVVVTICYMLMPSTEKRVHVFLLNREKGKQATKQQASRKQASSSKSVAIQNKFRARAFTYPICLKRRGPPLLPHIVLRTSRHQLTSSSLRKLLSVLHLTAGTGTQSQ